MSNKKHGVAHLDIKVYFEVDLTDEQIEEIVNEIECTIEHRLISDTHIDGYETY